MTFDLSGLESIKGRKDVQPKPEWGPLDLATLHPGVVLACDQSVSALGLVLFEVTPEKSCWVHIAQKFTEPPYKGHDGLLDNVDRLQDRLTAFIEEWVTQAAWGHVRAVHEHPPVNRGKMARPEVSLLSAYAFRRAVKERGLERLPNVGKQAHSKLICGDKDAKKPFHHAALKELYPDIRQADELVTNEALRDALSIALFAAHRGY